MQINMDQAMIVLSIRITFPMAGRSVFLLVPEAPD